MTQHSHSGLQSKNRADSYLGRTLGVCLLQEEIGRGGMGVVYRATHQTLGKDVAVKVLPISATIREQDIERFQREARLGAQIEHPNVVRIFGIGRTESEHYLVMEWLRGETLTERIQQQGALPWKEALEILSQAARGLGAAHRQSPPVIHRDVKPGNIMLTADGGVKVLDFGLVRVEGVDDLTRTDQIVGTAAFMAPEVVQGGILDVRVDVYALGVTAYIALSGTKPFEGKTNLDTIYKHVRDDPPPLGPRAPSLPFPVESLVLDMLAKNPEARPADGDETAERFLALLEGGGIDYSTWSHSSVGTRSIEADPGGAILLLGEIAVEQKFMGREQLRTALQIQATYPDVVPLGEVLVQESMLTRSQLADCLRLRAVRSARPSPIIRGLRTGETSFGRLAIRLARAAPEEVRQALRRQAEELGVAESGSPPRRLGEILMEMGVLTSDDVIEILACQRQSLYDCSDCGESFNVSGPVRADGGGVCPRCGSAKVRPDQRSVLFSTHMDRFRERLRRDLEMQEERGSESRRYERWNSDDSKGESREFSREEVLHILDQVLGTDRVDSQLVRELHTLCLPFPEEVSRWVREADRRGLLVEGRNGRWEMLGFGKGAYPEGLFSSHLEEQWIRSLDTLEQSNREVLGVLALLSVPMTLEDMGHAAEKDYQGLREEIEPILEANLLVVQVVQGISYYRFPSEKVRAVCGEFLPESERKVVHERVLQRMEDLCSDRLEDVAGDLARHARGCDQQEKYLLYRGMAACQAFAHGRFGDAQMLFEPFAESDPSVPSSESSGDETTPLIDPKISILEVQRLLGEIELEAGCIHRSREILDQVLRQTQALGESPSLSLVASIGRVRFHGGQVQEAQRDLLRSSPPGFDFDPWVILTRVGSEILCDRYGEARRLLDGIVSVGLDLPILGVRWHRMRAEVEYHLGEWQSVLGHLVDARVQALASDLQGEIPYILLEEARVHLAWGERARAVDLLGRVDAYSCPTSRPGMEVALLGLRGEVATLGGRWVEARNNYRTALELAREHRLALALPFLMQGLAWVADAVGKFEESRRWVRDAWARFDVFSCSRGLADCSHLLGRLELQAGRSREAGEHLDDALRLHAELGVEWRVPRLYLDLASLAESEKRGDQVTSYLSLARRIACRSGHRPTQALVYQILAARAASEGKTEKAEKNYQRAVASLR